MNQNTRVDENGMPIPQKDGVKMRLLFDVKVIQFATFGKASHHECLFCRSRLCHRSKNTVIINTRGQHY